MTEQQPYDLLRTEGAVEVRRYPEHLVAETEVVADFQDAGNRAFRYLFGYIDGAQRISPVLLGGFQRSSLHLRYV